MLANGTIDHQARWERCRTPDSLDPQLQADADYYFGGGARALQSPAQDQEQQRLVEARRVRERRATVVRERRLARHRAKRLRHAIERMARGDRVEFFDLTLEERMQVFVALFVSLVLALPLLALVPLALRVTVVPLVLLYALHGLLADELRQEAPVAKRRHPRAPPPPALPPAPPPPNALAPPPDDDSSSESSEWSSLLARAPPRPATRSALLRVSCSGLRWGRSLLAAAAHAVQQRLAPDADASDDGCEVPLEESLSSLLLRTSSSGLRWGRSLLAAAARSLHRRQGQLRAAPDSPHATAADFSQ